MRLGAIVLDSNNSEELSDFYQRLLGWPIERQLFEGEKWIIIKDPKEKNTPLVFQEVADYERPEWPSAKGTQQQMLHLDFYVDADDFDNAIKHAIFCGAVLSDTQFSDGWKVMIDPAGHPFCIIPEHPFCEIPERQE